MKNFSPEIDVEVAMSKDTGKRPGDQRGEDMFLADARTGLTGVFDGLGQGREGGTEEGRGADASGLAAFAAPALYEVIGGHFQKPEEVRSGLQKVIAEQGTLEHPAKKAATEANLAKEWSRHDPLVQKEIVTLFLTLRKLSDRVKDTKGLTTATLGKSVTLSDGRMFEIIGNIGDSGATKIGADGRAENITKEDSVLDYLLSKGMLTPEQAADSQFEFAPMKKSVKKLKTMMYQALGNPETPVVPRMTVVELKPGDEIVYASDGVRDEFSDANHDFDAKKAAAILGRKGASAETLVAAAEKEGQADKKDEKTVLRKKRLVVEDMSRLAIEVDMEEDVPELPSEALEEDTGRGTAG